MTEKVLTIAEKYNPLPSRLTVDESGRWRNLNTVLDPGHRTEISVHPRCDLSWDREQAAYEKRSIWSFEGVSPKLHLIGSDQYALPGSAREYIEQLCNDQWRSPKPGLPGDVTPVARRYLHLRAGIELERGEDASIFAVICGTLLRDNNTIALWIPPHMREMVEEIIRTHDWF